MIDISFFLAGLKKSASWSTTK